MLNPATFDDSNVDSNHAVQADGAERIQRRRFLQQLAAATAGTWMCGEPRLRAAETLQQPEPTADACIVLWMAGGMAAPDNFDPKRYHPFEVGTPLEEIISTFPAIDTAVDDIKICQGLEKIASYFVTEE